MTTTTEPTTVADVQAASAEFQAASIRLGYAVDGDERHPGTAPRTLEALAHWRAARDELADVTRRLAALSERSHA